MEYPHVFSFDDEGVTVALSGEAENVGVRRWIRSVSLDELPPDENVFTPKRLVISLEFYPFGEETRTIPRISGPAEIRVRYTPEDVDNAGGSWENLKLAYFWDGAWRLFQEGKHQFEVIPDSENPNNGEGIAVIQDWSDPPVAWGD